MPRKKKEPEVLESSWTDAEGFMRLPKDMLLEWRAHDAEVRAHSAELAMVSSQVSAEMGKNAELLRLFSQKQTLTNSLNESREALANILRDISKECGVEPKDLVINDKSGRLFTMLPDGSVGAAVKPVVKRRRKQAVSE